jgi:hypothetical protein
VAKLERVSSTPPRLTANVGYYIPPEVSSVEVTTAGGGGDNIRYYPYTNVEPGFEKMLSNVFTGVVKINSMTDFARDRSRRHGIYSATGHRDQFRRVRVVYLASHQFYG